jgi:pyruvate dehydrogenase E2 component (dihydrolipoamide acetyltransferase)
MATAVVMPKQGQTVESCILVEWKKRPGDSVAEGEILCEAETDKAVVEVPSPVAGTVLALFFGAGDDVPVMAPIAAIGALGEPVDGLRPEGATMPAPGPTVTAPERAPSPQAAPPATSGEAAPVSPRARALAAQRAVDLHSVQGSGPGGRIIERDVQAALAAQPKLSPVARAMVERGGYSAPAQGSGPGGRVMARDLSGAAPPSPPSVEMPAAPGDEKVTVTPLKGVRRVIADRMLASMQSTAQLTLHSSADARALLALRQRLKASDPALGLQAITINDLMLFAVSRVVPLHPVVNAHFAGNAIHQFRDVHLGFAVDTPRGLIVPVVRRANRLSLRQLAEEGKRLAAAAQNSTATPDELTGGTFTVTNLGNLGVEQFTPILNPPQVAILGVGSIVLKPVQGEGTVEFVPHLGLSLTINHQVVDGAPGARFLQALAQGLAQIDLLLAL